MHDSIPLLIKKVKEKKELQGIADSVVQRVVEKELKGYDSAVVFSNSQEKTLIKSIRAKLRLEVGRFYNKHTSLKKRTQLLEEGNNNQLLHSHASTKERAAEYTMLKKVMSDLDPRSILDLGCGLNPIALATPTITYYASDINEHDLALVQDFFTVNKITGKTFVYDLLQIKDDLPSADLCLLLKVFDTIEKKGHKLAEKIISLVPCPKLIVSFSTKTLSGKPMNHPQRGWIEQLCKRVGYGYTTFSTKNELFYSIEKSTNR